MENTENHCVTLKKFLHQAATFSVPENSSPKKKKKRMVGRQVDCTTHPLVPLIKFSSELLLTCSLFWVADDLGREVDCVIKPFLLPNFPPRLPQPASCTGPL